MLSEGRPGQQLNQLTGVGIREVRVVGHRTYDEPTLGYLFGNA